MKTYEIESLPVITFAHAYQADSYRGRMGIEENCAEITYITEGELKLYTEDGIFVAQKGDIICNLFQQELGLEATTFHSHHTVAANFSFRSYEDDMDKLYLPLLTKSSPDTEEIRRMIDKLDYDPSSYMGCTAKGAGYILRILSEIDRCNRRENILALPGDLRYVEKAKYYIHRHLGESITQQQVAEMLGISPGYLCAVFKKAENMTLMQYVNRTKLTGIKVLMEKNRLKLHEAAGIYGYSDPNYVSRLYKKTFGHNITENPTNA